MLISVQRFKLNGLSCNNNRGSSKCYANSSRDSRIYSHEYWADNWGIPTTYAFSIRTTISILNIAGLWHIRQLPVHVQFTATIFPSVQYAKQLTAIATNPANFLLNLKLDHRAEPQHGQQVPSIYLLSQSDRSALARYQATRSRSKSLNRRRKQDLSIPLCPLVNISDIMTSKECIAYISRAPWMRAHFAKHVANGWPNLAWMNHPHQLIRVKQYMRNTVENHWAVEPGRQKINCKCVVQI
jgi:hypothetical protein